MANKHPLHININQLSINERIELAQALWDSIADEQDALELSEAQRSELDKRLGSYSVDKDAEDLADFVRRTREPDLPYKDVVEDLKRRGKI